MRVTMVTGVRHNEQPGVLEAGEGARVTDVRLLLQDTDQRDDPGDPVMSRLNGKYNFDRLWKEGNMEEERGSLVQQ